MSTFNKGFLCPVCGPIPAAKKRSKNKVQVNTCPTCENLVSAWERPITERSGRCHVCGGGAFTLSMGIKAEKGCLLRKCKECFAVLNVDNGTRYPDKKEDIERWVKLRKADRSSTTS